MYLVHNHEMSREAYISLIPLSAQERKRIMALDAASFENRAFIEVPSAPMYFGRGGDIDLLLMAERRIYELSPKTLPRHFIICFRQSDVPQLVEYGLSKKAPLAVSPSARG